MIAKRLISRFPSTGRQNANYHKIDDAVTLKRSQTLHEARTSQLSVSVVKRYSSTTSIANTATSSPIDPQYSLHITNPDPFSDNDDDFENNTEKQNSLRTMTSDNLSVKIDDQNSSDMSSSIATFDDGQCISANQPTNADGIANQLPKEAGLQCIANDDNPFSLPILKFSRLSFRNSWLFIPPLNDSSDSDASDLTSSSPDRQSIAYLPIEDGPAPMTTKAMATFVASHGLKYSKVSCSLANNPEKLIKSYRKMAKKLALTDMTGKESILKDTNGKEMPLKSMYGKKLAQAAKLEFGKHLLDISSLYEAHRHESYQLELYEEERAHHRMVKRLQKEGVRWIRELAEDGHSEAAFMVATWFEKGLYGFKRHNMKAFRHHKIAANNGSPESMFALGLQDEEQGRISDALYKYKKAAYWNLVEAKYRAAQLYIRYYKGHEEEATRLLLEATEKGCVESPYLLALLLSGFYKAVILSNELIEHLGGPSSAASFWEIAANRGHVDAQFCLGCLYERGKINDQVKLKGVNLRMSFEYFATAATNGHTKAMVHLSRLLIAHSYVPGKKVLSKQDVSNWLPEQQPDELEAFTWCTRAIQQDPNDKDACYLLGWYYEAGIGTPRDFDRAQRYYLRAKEAGHTDAMSRLEIAQHRYRLGQRGL